MKVYLLLSCLLIATLFAGQALAVPPGQYTVTFYDDEAGFTLLTTHGICFEQSGTFYATTIPGCSGIWFQKGDVLRMVGNCMSGASSDAWQADQISKTLLTGNMSEWTDDGLYHSWMKLKFAKTSATCDLAPVDGASGGTYLGGYVSK